MRINVRAEFDVDIKQMEWGEVLDTLQAAVEDELGVTPNTPPSTPPPPALPTVLGHDIHPQPVGDVYEAHGGCSSHHMGIAPHSFKPPVMAAQTIIQTGSLYCQTGLHSQEQRTLYQSPENNHPGPSTSTYYPAAPPHSNNKVPAISFCESASQSLVPLRLVNREVVYAYTVHHPDSAPPPAPASIPEKRKRKYDKPQDDDRPYVKKPLNAFMLFMKEQRQTVVAEINNRNNATVNSILGQRWASLPNQEKHRFYEKAEKEKLLHARQNPGWSSSNNYGKKRKRQRRKVPMEAESTATGAVDVKEQTEQAAVMVASTSQMPHKTETGTLLFSSDNLQCVELL